MYPFAPYTYSLLPFSSIYHSLREVEAGAKRLAQVILGTSHLAQTVVPALLDPLSDDVLEWKQSLCCKLEQQAFLVSSALESIAGLHVIRPSGAMYALVRISLSSFDAKISDDIAFSDALLKEENVFVMPGSCFGLPNMFRIVYCAPESVLTVATSRIKDFCERHAIPAASDSS